MTDQRVYIATRRVRHIAVWIADLPHGPDNPAGIYRAICGSAAVADWPQTGDAPRLLYGADTSNGDARWDNHVCTRCRGAAYTIHLAATT